MPRKIALTVITASAVIMVAAALTASWGGGRDAIEGFGSDRPFETDAAISLVHVRPTGTVTLVLDALLGPTELPDPVADALAPLERYGLRIGGTDKSPLRVSDALHAKGTAMVAPLPHECRRSLRLLTPHRPATRPPTTLLDAARERTPVRVFCASSLEADLFAVAWAIAGGGDVESSPNVSVIHVKGGLHAAALAASAASSAASSAKSQVAIIVPVWGADGCAALRSVASAWSPKHAASVAYHPSDDDASDALLLKSASHVLAARAPTMRAAPGKAFGASPTPMLTLMYTHSIVVYDDGTDDEQAHDEQADAIADAVADALLLFDADAAATCGFYQSHGVRLLARASMINAATTARRMAVVADSPAYGRPAVSVLEQFDGGGLSPPVELVPDHDVPIVVRTIAGTSVREADVNDAGLGVRLRRGDRVTLTEQQRAAEENGAYVALGPGRIQSPPLLRPGAYRTTLVRDHHRRWVWRFSLPLPMAADGRIESFLHLGDEVAWGAAPGAPTGRVSSASKALVEVDVDAERVVASPSTVAFVSNWLHPLSVCSSDAWVATRQLCEGAPGREGQPVPVWDHPCERDADCPLLRPGPMHRGRCLAGHCELPVGARPVGYRSYDTSDDRVRPICRCADADRRPLRAASQACCSPTSPPVFELERA